MRRNWRPPTREGCARNSPPPPPYGGRVAIANSDSALPSRVLPSFPPPYGGRADLQLEDFPFGKLRFGAPLTGPTQFRAHKLPPPAGGRDAIYATSAPIYRVADLQKSDGGRLNCVRTLGARNSLSPPSRVCPVRDANPSGRRPPLCYLRSHIYGSGPKENYICPRFSTKNAEISKKIEDFLRYNFLREKFQH